jgi:hypothetical protein
VYIVSFVALTLRGRRCESGEGGSNDGCYAASAAGGGVHKPAGCSAGGLAAAREHLIEEFLDGGVAVSGGHGLAAQAAAAASQRANSVMACVVIETVLSVSRSSVLVGVDGLASLVTRADAAAAHLLTPRPGPHIPPRRGALRSHVDVLITAGGQQASSPMQKIAACGRDVRDWG